MPEVVTNSQPIPLGNLGAIQPGGMQLRSSNPALQPGGIAQMASAPGMAQQMALAPAAQVTAGMMQGPDGLAALRMMQQAGLPGLPNAVPMGAGAALQSQTAPLPLTPGPGVGVPGLSAGGYPMGAMGAQVPASMGGSTPLSVGRPEAVGAERRIPIAGQRQGRVNVPVDAKGQLGSIPVPQAGATQGTQGLPMGLPSFGNAAAIAQAPVVPTPKPARKR